MIGERDLSAAARRNLVVLAASMATLYAMIELVFGVSALTFEQGGGSEALAGVAPGIFLACAAFAALAAGRAMDRYGPRPVLAAGFAAGLAGCLLAALGADRGALAPALLGFALTGVTTGTVLLSRAAAAEMYPPERRPRAIALVLFGAVFGALLGPLVFGPLLGDDESGSAIALTWLGGAGFMAAGLVVAWRLRPDPREIGRALPAGEEEPGPAAAPVPEYESAGLRMIVSAPGVPAALLAVLASWAGMVTAMSLVGSALADHGHEHNAVFPVLAAHFVGMFAFFAVVGRVIERLGRVRSIVTGLLFLGASSVTLVAAVEQIHLAALVLFGVGLGWSLSFVAATAELSDRAPAGRQATLIGFADLLGDLSGAGLVVAGGFALHELGVAAIGVGAAVLPLLAAIWIARAPARPVPAASGAD